MSEPTELDILQLAEKHLSEEGQSRVKKHLDNMEDDLAKAYFLGVIDSRVASGELSNEDHREACEILGINNKDAYRIRTGGGKIN